MQNHPGLMASPRNCQRNHPRRIFKFWQRIVVIAGLEEVGSPSSTCAATNESQSFLSFGMFKCEDKERLMCPKYIT